MSISETRENLKPEKGNAKNKTAAQVEKILAGFRGEKSELITILQQVQQALGYLPQEAMRRIAGFVRVPESTLYGVATFYAQFKFVPTGRKVIRCCRGTACYVKGARRIIDEMEKLLGIKAGETTADMEYTLETVACIGACALAPTMTIDNETYGKMTPKKVAEALGDRNKAK